MSEKIYALLLRLFPSRFRDAYRDDALQLFRDRARDEKGLFGGPRLWLDLMADLAISVPREYFHAQPELAEAAADPYAKGTPTFYVLGDETPRPGALLLGGLLSLGAVVAVSILLTHGGNFRARRALAHQSQRGTEARPSAIGNAGLPLSDGTEESTLGSSQPQMGASPQTMGAAASFGTDEARPENLTSGAAMPAEALLLPVRKRPNQWTRPGRSTLRRWAPGRRTPLSGNV